MCIEREIANYIYICDIGGEHHRAEDEEHQPGRRGLPLLIMHIIMVICIYKYIERERDREREMYLYIYIYMYTHVYIYIYIHRESRSSPSSGLPSAMAPISTLV